MQEQTSSILTAEEIGTLTRRLIDGATGTVTEAEVEAIIECIREQYQQKTGLVDEVHKRSGFSKRKIIAALSRHTGPDSSKFQFWREKIGEHNSRFFELNPGSFFNRGGGGLKIVENWKTGIGGGA